MCTGHHRVKKLSLAARFVSVVGAACLCSAMFWQAAVAKGHKDGCSIEFFAETAEIISVFRKIEMLSNTLLHAQSQALIEMQSGFVLGIDDGGFFGPTGTLSKSTGKAQSDFRNLTFVVKRLALDADAASRLSNAFAEVEGLVTAGFEMTGHLEKDQLAEAVRIYAQKSLPQYKQVFSTVYTEVSGRERELSLLAAKCR